MASSLSPDRTTALLEGLTRSNRREARRRPFESGERQPIHTVYGGAHLFKATTPRRLGDLALAALAEHAPDARTLADAVGLEGGASLAHAVYERVVEKLRREPIEDYRIDFEDGFGVRPDSEEDGEAERAARELARGLRDGTLPPFIGIRVKSLDEEQKARALRTLDLFVSTLLAETQGVLPPNFVVTLPKVASVAQVRSFARMLGELEEATGLAAGALRLELMIELPQALLDGKGRTVLPRLARAAGGRCVAVHFGTYDYTAACGVTALHQSPEHPACDLARHLMQLAFAGTGIRISDGATSVLPVPPHRGGSLSPEELAENRAAVHAAFRAHYRHVRHALVGGFHQGWDLHPGQLPIRYAASFAYFLEGLDTARARLVHFLDSAARATTVGTAFDDAATGQGLLNTFLRAWSAGAIGEDELAQTGLTLDELRTRSFRAILEGRARR
ncbi:MAG: phosphoenolpyruvate kinase [Deltaproteobacteria bacterium]|nr:phosphoenolpyruvate kinase [Deltaproteobacteria bacterium]